MIWNNKTEDSRSHEQAVVDENIIQSLPVEDFGDVMKKLPGSQECVNEDIWDWLLLDGISFPDNSDWGINYSALSYY